MGYFFKPLVFIFAICLSVNVLAQSIQGTLKGMANMPVRMEVFDGFNSVVVEQTICDEKGSFHFNYANHQNAIGLLKSGDEAPFTLLLIGEQISLEGLALRQPESILITKGDYNILFDRYKKEIVKMEQAYDAWMYLHNVYLNTDVKPTKVAIDQEISRIEKEEELFLKNLPVGTYIKWYVQHKNLIRMAGIAARHQRDKIASIISTLRAVNYADEKWNASGLIKEIVDSQFWLIYSAGLPIDSMNNEMKISVDNVLDGSFANEKIYNDIANYLFELFDHQNLYTLTEYLTFRLQSKQGCALNDQVNENLDKFSKIKTGTIAPDILFEKKQNFAPNNNNNYPQKLSDINANYTLVVFGASWCPHCQKEVPQLAELNPLFNQKNIQVVLISLDDDSVSFNNFTRDLPFISYCDYAKWSSKIVNDYFVFSTPVMFLLDRERKILLRPNSVRHLNEWMMSNIH
jgi:thiol-disulfide isomerase/thioredoxin